MLSLAYSRWTCTAAQPEWERNLEAGRLAGSEIEKAVIKLENEANAEVVGSLLAIQEKRLGSVIS